jgi:O-antigen/teichoic acid export membrane protein
MLKKEVKTLARQSLAYSLGDFINNIINFLLFPVYIKMLTPEEYGILILMTLFGTLLMMLLRLGLNDGFMRLYFDYDGKTERKELLGSTYYGLLLVNVLMFIPLYLFIDKIAWLFLFDPKLTPEQRQTMLLLYTPLFTVTLIACVARSFLNVPFTLLQTQGRAKAFATISIVRFFSNMLLKFLFVAVFHWNVFGVVMVDLITALFFTAAFIPIVSHQVSFKPNFIMLKNLFTFGVPKVPHNLAHHLLNQSDRYILSKYRSLQEVGLYGVGYNIGTAVKFFSYAFNMAWSPYSFKIHKDKDGPQRIARLSTYHLSLQVFIAVLVSFFAKELFEIIDAILCIDKKWFFALPIVPLVTFAYVFQAAYFVTNVGISIAKKTKFYPMITGMSLIISVSINLILIPSLGIMGAAITAVISYAAMAGLALFFGQRLYKIPWEWKRLIIIFGVAIGLIIVSLMTNSFSLDYRFPLKFILLLSFPFMLWFFRYFEIDELNYIKRQLFMPVKVNNRR